MMTATVEKFEIEDELINFNGPEDDSDDFDDEDFDLEIDSIGGLDDFDDEDDDF